MNEKKTKVLSVVECRGTAYEIGYQYGLGCRESILKSLKVNFGLLTAGYQVGQKALIENALKYLPRVREFDPEVVELIRGQADGAGIDFEEAFALRCTLEIGPYFPVLSGLCTSFAAAGDATVDGKTLLGQNIDWYPDFPVDLLRIEHQDGLTQLCISLGGFAEYSLNSAGIGICANSTITPVEEYRLHLPLACYLPKTMRQKTISDALGVLCQAARGVAYYHLGSAEGDMVGIESVFDDYNVLYPEDDMLVHSNHYITERFKKGDLAYMGVADSYLRLHRMKHFMQKNHGSITPQTMMDILSDHTEYPTSICRHYDAETPRMFNAETLVSYIMIPAEGKILIAAGPPCSYEYVEYSL